MFVDEYRRIRYTKKIYDKEKDSESNSPLAKIYYESETKVDNEENNLVCNQIDEYFENEYNKDKHNIVDIISNIRKITSNLEEYILQVYKYGKNYYEYVSYLNGDILVSEVNKETGFEQIYVCNSDRLTINYEKEDILLNDTDSIDLINKELLKYYNLIISLNNMTKDNSLVKKEKEKSLKLTL